MARNRNGRSVSVEERAHERGRWGVTNAPRHLRARVAQLASMMGISIEQALEACVQAAEAAMSERAAELYQTGLRRRLCAPEGVKSRQRFVVADLPPLPVLETPLGIGMARQQLLVFAPHERSLATLAPSHPARKIIEERRRELEREMLPAVPQPPAEPEAPAAPPVADAASAPTPTPAGVMIKNLPADHPARALIAQRMAEIEREQREKQ